MDNLFEFNDNEGFYNKVKLSEKCIVWYIIGNDNPDICHKVTIMDDDIPAIHNQSIQTNMQLFYRKLKQYYLDDVNYDISFNSCELEFNFNDKEKGKIKFESKEISSSSHLKIDMLNFNLNEFNKKIKSSNQKLEQKINTLKFELDISKKNHYFYIIAILSIFFLFGCISYIFLSKIVYEKNEDLFNYTSNKLNDVNYNIINIYNALIRLYKIVGIAILIMIPYVISFYRKLI